MRTTYATLLCVSLVSMGCNSEPAKAQTEKAEDKKTGEKTTKSTLGIGDAAPGWNVTKWLNGSEVKGYDKDKVYVVEFWATWCGPCIKAMPHLAELQAEYKDKGLVVIGMTTKDDNNSLQAVTKFVDERGPKLGYVFAYCENDETDTAFMKAAKQEGIPCSFVIGRDQKIAYIGHPMMLDDVLPKVLEGTWKGQSDVEAIDKMAVELEKIFESAEKSPATTLDKLEAFGKAHPGKFKKDDVQAARLGLLVANGKFDEAKAIAEQFIATSEKKKNATPAIYAMGLVNKAFNPKMLHGDIAEKGIDLALKFEEKDVQLHLAAVEVFTALGKKDKAAEAGKIAVKNAPNEKAQKQVQQIVDQIIKGDK